MVKRLRKLVQYIWRYLTKSPNHNAFPSVSLFSAKTTGPTFIKILHNIVALVALFNLVYTRHYCIPFLNAIATKVQSLPFFTKLVAMAASLEISEKEVQIFYLHPKRVHS